MPRRPSKPASSCAGSNPKGRNRNGRPVGTRSVKYAPEVVQEICDRIAGGEIWSRIGGTEGMPDYSTLYEWLRRHPSFADAYAQARAAATEFKADEVVAVAQAATKETVQQDRLHVGSLKWHVSRADGLAARGASSWNLSKSQRLIVEVRRFERAWREDGTPYIREIGMPDGRGDDE